ncbi:hypothetical protein SISSUDRAFT_1133096 [Sistotremastrum suecicum HHB10207 ss-3]|uniref:BTB domain-containing protein n=1 Tax=Sistotremastrum suecicum HHB10207 ss-3 TaxID=1314776 RepID=A0A165XUC8_9AGAM|nr:hypothetical protein SISSUDRAFT_1133096 [Sistotremastrum suecicum HHB10207 ss-3]
MSSTASNHPEKSSSAFRFPDADLIIRSNDNVNFRVHKSIMRLSSSVLHDTLTLGDLTTLSTPSTPIVDVSEPSNLIDAMLRYIYPLPRHPLEDLRHIRRLLELGDKYDIQNIATAIEDLLLGNTITELYPTQFFALTKKFQLTRLRAFVETILVKKPFALLDEPQGPDEIDHITAEDIRRVEFYRRRRISSARQHFDLEGRTGLPMCECRTRQIIVDDYDDYQSEAERRKICQAWRTLTKICCEALDKDPTLDVTAKSLRELAVENSSCQDARKNLFHAYDVYVQHAQDQIKRIPWTFPLAYAEHQKLIRCRTNDGASIKFRFPRNSSGGRFKPY